MGAAPRFALRHHEPHENAPELAGGAEAPEHFRARTGAPHAGDTPHDQHLEAIMNWIILALAALATGSALMSYNLGQEARRREKAFAERGADFYALEARITARKWGRVFVASWIAGAGLAAWVVAYA